jgi:tRNA-2-methylthio-N6-dimethylallyladenosine synthase
VPAEVAGERLRRLVEVVEGSCRRRHQERVGRTEEVLVEGPSKRDPSMLTARTRQNKVVHVPGPLRPGTYAEARITSAGAHHLMGEVVEVTGRPRRTRVRIAVRAG